MRRTAPKPEVVPAPTCRELKVLCMLPIPHLVDTLYGAKVVYTGPDGWYKNHPWDSVNEPEAEEAADEGDVPEAPFDLERKFPWRRTRT